MQTQHSVRVCLCAPVRSRQWHFIYHPMDRFISISFYFRYSNVIPICCIHIFSAARSQMNGLPRFVSYLPCNRVSLQIDRMRGENKQIKRNQRRNCKHLMSNQRNNCKLLHFSDPIIYKCMAFLVHAFACH